MNFWFSRIYEKCCQKHILDLKTRRRKILTFSLKFSEEDEKMKESESSEEEMDEEEEYEQAEEDLNVFLKERALIW